MPRFMAIFNVKAPVVLSSSSVSRGVEFVPAAAGFVVKKEVEGTTFDKAESSAELWACSFREAFCLVKKTPVRIDLDRVEQVGPAGPTLEARGFLHHSITARITVSLEADEISTTLEVAEKLNAQNPDSLVMRAANWYVRGQADSDPLDRFIDHWIGLETLSNTYSGQVDPSRCMCCDNIINSRPHGGVLRAFLSNRGLGHKAELAMELANIRGKLFHVATAVEQAVSKLPDLTSLLQESLLASLR